MGTFLRILGCGGCVAGGVSLAMAGWGAILVAIAKPGSIGAVAGCIGVCASLF